MGTKIRIDPPGGNPMAFVKQVRDDAFRQYSAPMQLVRTGPTIAIITFGHEEIVRCGMGAGPDEKALVWDFEVAMPLETLRTLKTSIETELAKYGGDIEE